MSPISRKQTVRVAVLTTFCLALAACATPPQPDLTPPPKPRVDAKADLERGRR
jgi:starvation-inducible outer membrane lipoprotein